MAYQIDATSLTHRELLKKYLKKVLSEDSYNSLGIDDEDNFEEILDKFDQHSFDISKDNINEENILEDDNNPPYIIFINDVLKDIQNSEDLNVETAAPQETIDLMKEMNQILANIKLNDTDNSFEGKETTTTFKKADLLKLQRFLGKIKAADGADARIKVYYNTGNKTLRVYEAGLVLEDGVDIADYTVFPNNNILFNSLVRDLKDTTKIKIQRDFEIPAEAAVTDGDLEDMEAPDEVPVDKKGMQEKYKIVGDKIEQTDPNQTVEDMAKDCVILMSILKDEGDLTLQKFQADGTTLDGNKTITPKTLAKQINQLVSEKLALKSEESVKEGKPFDIAKLITGNKQIPKILRKAYVSTLDNNGLPTDVNATDSQKLESYIKERTQKVKVAVLSSKIEKGEEIGEEGIKQYLEGPNISGTKKTSDLTRKELEEIPEKIKWPNGKDNSIFPIDMKVTRTRNSFTKNFSDIKFDLTIKDTNISFTLDKNVSGIEIMESIRTAGLYNTLKMHQDEFKSLKLENLDIKNKFKSADDIKGFAGKFTGTDKNAKKLVAVFKFSDLVASDADKYREYAKNKANDRSRH